MASQRASITKELLRESLESVLKPFKIHLLDDGKFLYVLEFLMSRKVFVNRPTGSGTQLVVSNIRLFSRVHSRRARCEESVLSGYKYVQLNLFPTQRLLLDEKNCLTLGRVEYCM